MSVNLEELGAHGGVEEAVWQVRTALQLPLHCLQERTSLAQPVVGRAASLVLPMHHLIVRHDCHGRVLHHCTSSFLGTVRCL